MPIFMPYHQALCFLSVKIIPHLWTSKATRARRAPPACEDGIHLAVVDIAGALRYKYVLSAISCLNFHPVFFHFIKWGLYIFVEVQVEFWIFWLFKKSQESCLSVRIWLFLLEMEFLTIRHIITWSHLEKHQGKWIHTKTRQSIDFSSLVLYNLSQTHGHMYIWALFRAKREILRHWILLMQSKLIWAVYVYAIDILFIPFVDQITYIQKLTFWWRFVSQLVWHLWSIDNNVANRHNQSKAKYLNSLMNRKLEYVFHSSSSCQSYKTRDIIVKP